MARSKAYLFRGIEIVELRSVSAAARRVFRLSELHFPVGLGDFLSASLDGRAMLTPRPFLDSRFPEGGSVEWAIAWPRTGGRVQHSYCNTTRLRGGTTRPDCGALCYEA